ncbi:uncharacterized protein LOC111113944 isoform X1 [Crassostrea virginica]
MESTRISTQVNVKHCSLCQGDTEYYCYGCRQDLCFQCRKLHVIDLSTKHHIVTSYTEKMIYPPKQAKNSQSQDPKQVISVQSQDPDEHEPCVIPFTEYRPHKFIPPVWLSPLERSEMQRQQYSRRVYNLRGETIYYRSVLLEGLRHDRETGHKAVTIRGQSKAEIRGQGLKDLIDEVLAGNLEDRCIIQKTRMTRHMTKLLRYYHRFEQLSETMETRPFKFLRIMTQKHSPRKDDMKPIIYMLVNLMKEIRLVPSGIPRRAGVEDLLTLLSSPVVHKTLSVTGVKYCFHISCVTPDRVWVSDVNNLILTDTVTGKQLHKVEHQLDSATGIHTVNCEGELIYIDEEYNIIKLCNDMKTTTTLIKHTDTTWKPFCVYCSPSSGDLLVGMWKKHPDTETSTGKVMRYDNSGKHKQTIPHNDNTPHDLYEDPWFITENNNGDVVVSDFDRAVVVTSSEGVHRFSYTGPPSGSGLEPRGICTDVMLHILVSDLNTSTVQMLDRDGQFLSYVLTRQTPGMDYRPSGLRYDVSTHAVWVGSDNNNKMTGCRHINRHLHFIVRQNASHLRILDESRETLNCAHVKSSTNEVDEIQVDKEVNKIWNQASSTGYILARCGDVNLTDEDIVSLKGNNWLTDQVIDSYLGAVAEAETDKGKKVLRIATSTMTSIIEGHNLQNMTLRNVQLGTLDVIIGAHLQQMGHWNLVVIEPSMRNIVFFNSLGETHHQKERIKKNWSDFYSQRVVIGLELQGPKDWSVETPQHTKQTDGYNCGVFVLLFAQRYFTKEKIVNISSAELQLNRMRIAKHLLMYQVYIRDRCPACGLQIQPDQNKTSCNLCERQFHQMPFCLGEISQDEGHENFTCKSCVPSKEETMMVLT